MPNQKNQAEWRRTMDNTTNLPLKQTLDGSTSASNMEQRSVSTRRNVAITLWLLGFIAIVGATVMVIMHPAPWPFDLQTTITLQHLQLPSWLSSALSWPSIMGDPYPFTAILTAWLVVLSLIGVVVWLRGRSPMRWFVTAIFIFFGTILMVAIDFITGTLVARPRPSSPLIHVYMPITIVPSFPSGHVATNVFYYGFLLYLSFTKPISQWRYRWILIPFQVYAALNILLIGYSRVLEGSHWLTDALAGYLFGALFLVLLIYLYRWTLDKLTKRRAKRLVEKSTQNQLA